MSEWQPIETAPKDGTQILAYGRYGWGGYAKRKIGWAVISWAEEFGGDESRWVLVHDNPYVDVMFPTYWMPLPKAPPLPTD